MGEDRGVKNLVFFLVTCLVISQSGFGVLLEGDNTYVIPACENSLLEQEDIEYLTELAHDTFECLLYFVNQETGLPYDSSSREPFTSITNIGLYLASLCAGYKMGFIEETEALDRITKTLESLGRIPRWHGFPITWVDVSTLSRYFSDPMSYADHVGNLLAGLIVTKETFPQFRDWIESYIAQMDFGFTYDEKTGWLKGGWDPERGDFAIKQPWGDWYYNFLAADTRIFSFYGVASGKIPRRHWDSLKRDYIIWEGEKIYYPGWEGGGLFMQYLPGIFLNEEGTKMKESARAFARAQIKHKDVLGYPGWGWSACEAPDGRYLGWGTLKDEVITPHASLLAIEDFPMEVIANLKELEKFGVRAPFVEEGKEYNFGFRDSYNVRTGETSEKYLILDQAMIFLSLANFLTGGFLRNAFSSDPIIQAGLKALRDNY